jgi:hypothetical protein
LGCRYGHEPPANERCAPRTATCSLSSSSDLALRCHLNGKATATCLSVTNLAKNYLRDFIIHVVVTSLLSELLLWHLSCLRAGHDLDMARPSSRRARCSHRMLYASLWYLYQIACHRAPYRQDGISFATYTVPILACTSRLMLATLLCQGYADCILESASLNLRSSAFYFSETQSRY